VFGAGDQLTINVWRNSDLSRTVQVDPAGDIYLPLAGRVHAGGLTQEELRAEVARKYSRYIRNPHVDINVSDVSSQRVHILGEVESPGTFSLEPNMLLWEAISAAGGFSDDANRRRVLVMRAIGETTKVAVVDVGAMLKTGKMDRTIYLQRDDVVYVPPTVIADVEAFMLRVNNIVNTLVNIERGIVLYPQVIDALKNEETESSVIVAP
jgi:polysaccharide export outer membrane protein